MIHKVATWISSTNKVQVVTMSEHPWRLNNVGTRLLTVKLPLRHRARLPMHNTGTPAGVITVFVPHHAIEVTLKIKGPADLGATTCITDRLLFVYGFVGLAISRHVQM